MTERVAALYARLDKQHDDLIAAIRVLSSVGASEAQGSMVDNLFRLLGIVTFWRSLPEPSEKQIADVNQALNQMTIEVVRAPRREAQG